MEAGADERREAPELPEPVPRSERTIQPGTSRKLVGYFDDFGDWTYSYRWPGDWLTPGDGYDYRP